MATKEIPVLLLTGYLGSGKTTLVNHILANRKGIKFAVIVNDIGEVNIDADLIQKGGVVGKKDDSLVALQNGCICCTLKADLVEQIYELMCMDRFDYIVIEASGICEPDPIAQTIGMIPTLGPAYTKHGVCRLDCIVTVVDALRMQSEFACGDVLTRKDIDEEDIENLIIRQIEFCNIILLNKASEVRPEELARIKQIIMTLQPGAQIIECDYADVDLERIINTRLFNFDRVATSAGWVRGIDSRATAEEEIEARNPGAHLEEHHGDAEGEHGHHHHHHHEGGEVEEYGIGTFVYYRRPAFDINKFDNFVARKWPSSVIRAKGVCYFTDNEDMSYMFEQVGKQKILREAGLWYAAAPEEDRIQLMKQDPDFFKDWDGKYGDRMQKIVFIGQHMDKERIIRDLDACLE